MVSRLLREATGISRLHDGAARAQIRAGWPHADPDDLLLFDDLLGIADPGVGLPVIDPGARRRRLTADYRELRDRYRALATSLGFEGHMKWAEEMA